MAISFDYPKSSPGVGDWLSEVAVSAARLVVEEGLEYGAAKRRASRQAGRYAARSSELPSNERVEDEVRRYIALFCAESQPIELAALRRLALAWMERLPEFRPHLTGAVWRGTATRLSPVCIDLFCDDAKSAAIALLNQGVIFDVETTAHGGATVECLVFCTRCDDLSASVVVRLSVLDHDDLRGALRPDASGRSWRGDAAAVARLVEASGPRRVFEA